MRITSFRPATLGICAVAMMAGCDGSQHLLNAPGAMPQAIPLASGHTMVHRIGTASPSYQVLYRFGDRAGDDAKGALISLHGTFYGTTYGGGASKDGTVYSLTAAGKRKFLHSFAGGSSDGVGPVGSLVNVHGTMYGATINGGTCSQGTVYSITPTGTEKLLHSFCGSSEGLEPQAGLIYVNGLLYGTTSNGFGDTGGTIYSISTAGTFKVLYRFGNPSKDGGAPDTPLLYVNGALYGTTPYGGGSSACSGDYGCGTVYSVTLSGKEKVRYRFQGGSDGWFPVAGLISVGGTLYGTTRFGGQSGCEYNFGCGIVYGITTSATENVLYRFTGGADGGRPEASLLEMNGLLYSTTYSGGSLGEGTLFSVTANGNEQVLHSFGGNADGAFPESNLTSLRGTLYGTTDRGGDEALCRGKGCGSVFALTP